MKKHLLSFLFFLTAVPGISQTIPETPLKVEFANVQILLNADARQKINAEVQRLLTPQSTYLNQKLERMQLYFPIIEKILETENVPDDIKYLAVLESDLNADAVSPTKAVGFWQFKDFTAKEMGLTMSGTQDDRKNLHLSTRAAAQYLKKNNKVFKNWVSTTLSYTAGAGGAADLVPVEWSFASEIKLEKIPHPYLIKALAHKLAYSHRLRQTPPTSKALVEYPAKGKKITDIASEINLPEEEIRQYNSWLRASSVPTDKDYVILLQTDKAYAGTITTKANDLAKTDYISIGYPKLKRQTLVVTSTDQPVFYEINDKRGILAQSGDEVSSLARKGKTSIYKFLSYNDMTDRDRVKDGTVYYLQKKHKRGPVPYHTVSDQQNLWEVAHIYGLRLKKLKKFNRLAENEDIRTGRVLWLQKKRPRKTAIQYNTNLTAPPEVLSPETTLTDVTTAVPDTPEKDSAGTRYITHRVLENETLFSLAKKYGTTVEKLRELNRLKPNEGIQYNQRLQVPYSDEPEDDWVEDEKKQTQAVLMPPKKETVPKTETPKEKPMEIPVVTTPAEKTTTPVVRETPAGGVSAAKRHRVSPGETLFSIANRYGTTVAELRRMNNMSPSETLKSGTTLIVSGAAAPGTGTTGANSSGAASTGTPGATSQGVATPGASTPGASTPGASTPGTTRTPEPSKNTATASTHTVQRGETLFSIANRYGLTVDELRSLNGLSANSIQAGQKLKVKEGSSPAAPEAQYHTVKAGETLFSISNRYGVTVEDLKYWNNMKNNNLVSGKKIIVKK
ncbi:MAG: LysM peptidoglycan-binding domain-containing protein [Leadbetterella sp.]|nr:LysM peptidoglycan-binding domain-containing protein [Leadbetterella sp.]